MLIETNASLPSNAHYNNNGRKNDNQLVIGRNLVAIVYDTDTEQEGTQTLNCSLQLIAF